jgi:hypothetical protein
VSSITGLIAPRPIARIAVLLIVLTAVVLVALALLGSVDAFAGGHRCCS